MNKCIFCQSKKTKLLYQDKYHKFKNDHGPISFYQCEQCGSGLTFPLPNESSLSELYSSFDGGMSGFTRSIRESNPLDVWYNQCVDRLLAFKNPTLDKYSEFNWVDVGAGNGEVAKIISKRFPGSRGFAIDYHERPAYLNGIQNVIWIQCDLNDLNFSDKIPHGNFDVVLSITVLEHVLNPYNFVKNMMQLKAEHGVLYLTTPDMGSIAAKVLGKFWPYLIFGEHLNIPSKTGMRAMLENVVGKNIAGNIARIHVSPVILPYPLTYYLDHYELKTLSYLFSKKRLIKVNTGILEAAVY